MKYKYIFGPVTSRRLGLSLGIDMVPYKTCGFNCVYCECGTTTALSVERKEYVPTQEIINEISKYLETGPALDYVTFGGSGEPTLHSGLGAIASHVKRNFPQYRLALLTNAMLLHNSALRQEVTCFDLIKPSLDAVSRETFIKINRCHPAVNIDRIIDGLVHLRNVFKGQLWLEIFIVPGLNDTQEELALFKDVVKKIAPDKIQLNTLDRPGPEKWVKPATRENLERIAAFLGNAEIIAKFPAPDGRGPLPGDMQHALLSMLRRRPCTVSDLAESLAAQPGDIEKYLRELLKNGRIKTEQQQRGLFYCIN